MAVRIFVNGNQVTWPHSSISYDDVAKLSGHAKPVVQYGSDYATGQLEPDRTVAADKDMHFTVEAV